MTTRAKLNWLTSGIRRHCRSNPTLPEKTNTTVFTPILLRTNSTIPSGRARYNVPLVPQMSNLLALHRNSLPGRRRLLSVLLLTRPFVPPISPQRDPDHIAPLLQIPTLSLTGSPRSRSSEQPPERRQGWRLLRTSPGPWLPAPTNAGAWSKRPCGAWAISPLD